MFQFISGAFSRSSDANDEASKHRTLGPDHDRLPILIIPGFMSSGLEIEHSPKRPKWKGKRIWLNLKSLGVEHLKHAALTPWEKALNRANRKGTDMGTFDEDEDDTEDQLGTNNSNAPRTASQLRRQQSAKEEAETLRSLRAQQAKIRSDWCQHMLLREDFVSERDGIRVRAIPGLEGVNYLYPGFMTNMITFVFGPLIDFLTAPTKSQKQKRKQQPTEAEAEQSAGAGGGGYQAGVDLQAAPWDWRLPPSELEKRDQYYTRTLEQIETMYKKCDNLPVVLLAHSLGSLVAQYLLQYALERKGQAWIDKHIYAFVPVAGSHRGAPKSIKQTILVGGSIVQNFLNYEEAVLMGRSLGSSPWMFPTQLPPDAPAVAWVHPQGIFQIKLSQPLDVMPLVKERSKFDLPRRYQLQAALGKTTTPEEKKKVRLVSSQFLDTTDNTKSGVDFTTETYCFVTPPHDWKDQEDFTIQLYLREPEWTKNIKSKLKKQPILNTVKGSGLVDLIVFPFGILNTLTLGKSRALAASDPIALKSMNLKSGETRKQTLTFTHLADSGGMSCCTPAAPRQTTVEIEVTWNAFDTSPIPQVCENVAQPHENGVSLTFQNDETGEIYQPLSGHDALHNEGRWGHTYLKTIQKVYRSDPYGPNSISATDPPPVKRVHAIYGTNVPTDIGSFLCRVDECVSKRRQMPIFHLDKSGITLKKPQAQESSPDNVKETYHDYFEVKGPILTDVHTPTHPSGDGTVPYWSLNWVEKWKEPSPNNRVENVTIKELPGAPHREILSDKRFFAEILRYCTKKKEETAVSPRNG